MGGHETRIDVDIPCPLSMLKIHDSHMPNDPNVFHFSVTCGCFCCCCFWPLSHFALHFFISPCILSLVWIYERPLQSFSSIRRSICLERIPSRLFVVNRPFTGRKIPENMQMVCNKSFLDIDLKSVSSILKTFDRPLIIWKKKKSADLLLKGAVSFVLLLNDYLLKIEDIL